MEVRAPGPWLLCMTPLVHRSSSDRLQQGNLSGGCLPRKEKVVVSMQFKWEGQPRDPCCDAAVLGRG